MSWLLGTWLGVPRLAFVIGGLAAIVGAVMLYLADVRRDAVAADRAAHNAEALGDAREADSIAIDMATAARNEIDQQMEEIEDATVSIPDGGLSDRQFVRACTIRVQQARARGDAAPACVASERYQRARGGP